MALINSLVNYISPHNYFIIGGSTSIRTGKGDNGFTDNPVFGEARVPKDHISIEVLGSIDELNSFIGLARSLLPTKDLKEINELRNELLNIQVRLFRLGTSIIKCGVLLSNEDIKYLERRIAELSKIVEARCFIVPGGHSAASALHVARAVCRRLERRLVTLSRVLPQCVSNEVLKYVNILSDYLYLLALYVNKLMGVSEVKL